MLLRVGGSVRENPNIGTLPRKARRFVGVAVEQLPDPAQRAAWSAWARGWQWWLPFGKAPEMPPDILEIAMTTVENRIGYIRSLLAAESISP